MDGVVRMCEEERIKRKKGRGEIVRLAFTTLFFF